MSRWLIRQPGKQWLLTALEESLTKVFHTIMKKLKNLLTSTSLSFLVGYALIQNSQAGTITVSATGLSSAPIFVTSTLSSLTVGMELNIGTFLNPTALANTIATYKAGVEGIGNTSGEAQADANTKKSALYTATLNWLSSSSNYVNFVAAADTISQTGTTATGKFLFNSSASRSVNGVSGTYAGSNGTFAVTYANYAAGAAGSSAPLWAWFATGSEIGIVTDSTWVVPTNNASGLTIGTANLTSNLASEILLGTYTDYASGSDLISSSAISQTLTVIPEPSSLSLLAASLIYYGIRRKNAKFKCTKGGV